MEVSRRFICDTSTELMSCRYPEVLQMETEVFSCHCSEPAVQAAMSETFQDIAQGRLPHSSLVLDSLFKKFASITVR